MVLVLDKLHGNLGSLAPNLTVKERKMTSMFRAKIRTRCHLLIFQRILFS
jgi:hypothetical protein